MRNEDTKGHAWSQASGEAILAHFRNRPLRGCGQHFHDFVCHLLRLILEHRDFHSLELLVEYCGDYDNLRPWLLHEADRVMFSAELVQGLKEVATDAGGGQQSGPSLE